METLNYSTQNSSQNISRLNSITFEDIAEWNHDRRRHESDDDIQSSSNHSHELISRQELATEYEFHKYFINVAIILSQKRKKVKHQAGACIVNPTSNRIVGTGYYTHSETIKNEVLSWFKDKNRPKNDYLNHAEVNAIANKKEATLENCIMYVTSFPCIECSKLIAQSGIAKVVYLEDACCQTLNEKEIAAARILLQLAGVILIKFQ